MTEMPAGKGLTGELQEQFFSYFIVFEDVRLVEFMYLLFTRMRESYRRRISLSSPLFFSCDVFRGLINSLCLLISSCQLFLTLWKIWVAFFLL